MITVTDSRARYVYNRFPNQTVPLLRNAILRTLYRRIADIHDNLRGRAVIYEDPEPYWKDDRIHVTLNCATVDEIRALKGSAAVDVQNQQQPKASSTASFAKRDREDRETARCYPDLYNKALTDVAQELLAYARYYPDLYKKIAPDARALATVAENRLVLLSNSSVDQTTINPFNPLAHIKKPDYSESTLRARYRQMVNSLTAEERKDLVQCRHLPLGR